MKQAIQCWNNVTDKGYPNGGGVLGNGIDISWQKGPLRNDDGTVNAPNGAFVEDVIRAALQRIEFYNESPFRCRENSLAITKLEEALHWLNARTERRTEQGTEGTWQGA